MEIQYFGELHEYKIEIEKDGTSPVFQNKASLVFDI